MTEPRNRSRRDFLKTALTGAGLGFAGAFAATPALARQQAEGKAAADRVPRKTLGTTGQTIPILLQGCAMTFDPKYDKILHRGFQEGVDYLDTALMYANGESHRTIAPFLKQVGRDKVWVTTKGPSNGATVERYTRDLDTCLEQLDTDYADLYFMHEVDDPKYLDPEYLAMGDRMRKSGKTRFFGFSCHGKQMVECMDKAAGVKGIDVIMFRYNFARYGDLELNKVIDKCKAADIGLIAMKTQNSVPDDQKHVRHWVSENFTLGQAKLKSVWADDRIDSAVSHMNNTTIHAENIAAAKSPIQLSMAEFQQLQRIATSSAHLACQGCTHICEPLIDAPVQVGASLRYLMYHECYGEPDRARELYAALRPEERTCEGVDFRAATAACPQKIDIAARLATAREKLAVV